LRRGFIDDGYSTTRSTIYISKDMGFWRGCRQVGLGRPKMLALQRSYRASLTGRLCTGQAPLTTVNGGMA